MIAALVGLLATSRMRRHAIRGRFLLLLVLVGLAGGLVDRLPFGPSGAGRRVTLWFVPAMAVGLAAVLQLARGRIADHSTLRRGLDILAFALAAVVVVTALWRDTPEYPFPGSKSAAEFIDSRLGKNDEVLVLSRSPVLVRAGGEVPLRLAQSGRDDWLRSCLVGRPADVPRR